MVSSVYPLFNWVMLSKVQALITMVLETNSKQHTLLVTQAF